MDDVSTLRLNLLRAAYFLISVGLAVFIWPLLLSRGPELPHMNGVVCALLGTVCLFAFVGLRYPLRMLPILLFELMWKVIWTALIGLPLWMDGKLVGDYASTMKDNMVGLVVLPLLIPWGYVWRTYVKAPGERWRPHRSMA